MNLWDNISGTWKRTPKYRDIASIATRIDTQWYAAQGRWEDLESWGIYEEWTSAEDAPLGYLNPVIELHDGRNKAARHPSGTAQERADVTRQNLSAQIEAARMAADIQPINLALDPGKQVLLDEANASAAEKLTQLDDTADADLSTFDADLDPSDISAMAAAQSLINQELALYSQPSLSQTDKDAIDTAIAAQQAVIDAGDPDASVPGPPDVIRRLVGVVGEGFGTLIFRRVLSGGWWYPEFELQVDRELDVSQYWVAVYDGNGTYLSTPFLTEISEGVYGADKTATNLPRGKDFVFQATICHGHISNPQFAKVKYAANVERQVNRVRWGGVAS